jgi:hypothetical protein
MLLGERLVDAPPRDAILRLGLLDGELVLRGAAGEPAGVDDERPRLGDPGLAAQDGVLVRDGRARVAQDRAGGGDAVLGEVDCLSGAIVIGVPPRSVLGAS